MHIYPVALAGTCLLTSVQAVDFTSVAVNPILAAVSHIPGAPFLLEAVAQTRTSTVTQTATASQTSSSTSSASRQSQPASKQKTYTPVTATLADGTSPKSGSFNSTLRWQSSGVLQHGGCPTDAEIGDCYSMYLASGGMLEQEPESSASAGRRRRWKSPPPLWNPYHADLGLDSPYDYFTSLLATRHPVRALGPVSPFAGDTDLSHFLRLATTQDPSCKGGSSAAAGQRSLRQRIEMLSWPPAAGGETWDYRWRSYLDERTHATNHFFHLMQILHRDGCAGYVIAQDATLDRVQVVDHYRACSNDVCASSSLEAYKGKTVQHHIRVTYGSSGAFAYTVKDARSDVTILEYNALGDMGSSTSVKFGLYRASVEGMGEARGYVGDYAATRIA